MKKFAFYIVSSLALLTISSCSKEDCNCAGTGEFEYMIFGHFYAECGGEGCVEIFKLDTERLYEDTTDVYPNELSPYQGQYINLADDKYQLVKDIIHDFPQALYAEPQIVIGMPDAGDWGGIYVEMKYKNEPGLTGYWLLDQHEGNMPAIYNEFVDRINEKIALIHQ